MRLVLLSELAGKEQSVHMLENYTKNAKSDNLDYCWCWWLRGDMCLVNIGKRMVPQSLLSGVWENVKLSRILGFMSRELITQYFLFSLKFSHTSWNQQMPWCLKRSDPKLSLEDLICLASCWGFWCSPLHNPTHGCYSRCSAEHHRENRKLPVFCLGKMLVWSRIF